MWPFKRKSKIEKMIEKEKRDIENRKNTLHEEFRNGMESFVETITRDYAHLVAKYPEELGSISISYSSTSVLYTYKLYIATSCNFHKDHLNMAKVLGDNIIPILHKYGLKATISTSVDDLTPVFNNFVIYLSEV